MIKNIPQKVIFDRKYPIIVFQVQSIVTRNDCIVDNKH